MVSRNHSRPGWLRPEDSYPDDVHGALLLEVESLEFDPQNPHKRPGLMCTCNPGAGKAETDG